MTDEWQDTPEDDGITLGPEEALEREIAKSKGLKVERLQLRDRVDRLTAENRALQDENETLKQHLQARSGTPKDALEKVNIPTSNGGGFFLPSRWAFFLLVFNLAAIGFLLIYLLRNPTP